MQSTNHNSNRALDNHQPMYKSFPLEMKIQDQAAMSLAKSRNSLGSDNYERRNLGIYTQKPINMKDIRNLNKIVT